MATSIIPKSEMRRNENIVYGYGEVPAIYGRQTKWGLPNGRTTTSPAVALKWAKRIDAVIRASVSRPEDLLKSRGKP